MRKKSYKKELDSEYHWAGFKRLKSKIWKSIEYVRFDEIRKFHGEEWFKKWCDAAGTANTSPIIKNGKEKPFAACDYYDYLRFSNVVDFNKPTYFD